MSNRRPKVPIGIKTRAEMDAEYAAKMDRRSAKRTEFKYECLDVNHDCDFYCNTIAEYIDHVNAVHLCCPVIVTEYGCCYCGKGFQGDQMFREHVFTDGDAHWAKVAEANAAGVTHLMYRAFGPVAQVITIEQHDWRSYTDYGPLVDRTELGLASYKHADH